MGVIALGPKQITLGESKSDLVGDAGFSASSYGLNLTKKKGALYFVDGGTDRSQSVLTGTLIASAYDKNLLGNDNYFLDDEGAFYTYNGTTLTKRQTVTADTFVSGTSDMLQFLGSVFATSQTRVVKLDSSDITTLDSSWWTGLTTSYRHPLERVEDKLAIGDVNNIHVWDGTTSTANWVVLPTDVNITSLRKHPDGRTLLAFCGLTANASHTRGLGGRVYYVDMVLRKWTREVELDVQVEGSRVVGGTVYVTYGRKLGYFNGDGVMFLKDLPSSQTTYSHNLIAFEDILVTRDGRDILMFGDLGQGKVWWRSMKNTTNTQEISCLAYQGDNKLLYGFGNGSGGGFLYDLDFDNVGNFGIFYSNRYVLEAEIKPQKFIVLHDTSNSSGQSRFVVSYRDHNDNTNTLIDRTFTNVSAQRTEENIDLLPTTEIFQFSLSPSQDDLGFYQFRIPFNAVQ